MRKDSLLENLGYDKSPHFLQGDQLDSISGYSHIFRRASNLCSLSGVYVLREPGRNSRTVVPSVYVCDAESVEQADAIHKNVWNQNVVPFLVISTPEEVRLYSGFRYAEASASSAIRSEAEGILITAIRYNQVAEKLRDFQASSIDNGTLWREMGRKLTPESRLDWQLLNNLKTLDQNLQASGATREKAHSLIGKYVYIRYLRDRNIISDRKLNQWHLNIEDVFGRNARIDALQELISQLEKWLNGSIFPLTLDASSASDAQYLRMVASTFKGDNPDGQMHLNFRAYDFSYIPIETLSVIYEQFLHSTGTGKDVGAYYTPLPLVNFMLEELDDRRPLVDGMKVFDPACGSGAFLVQCYRRLIEREIGSKGEIPGPERLRALLSSNIYGVDQDPDACAVAELSLTLTLLDYVNPPDLEDNTYKDFKLPSIRNKNIFNINFFDENMPWDDRVETFQFQWVVGNPPWMEVDRTKLKPHEVPAVAWMDNNQKEFPVGRLQLAEAFAWKCTLHADPECLFALLLPATTLFKSDAHRFRRDFFSRLDVWCIVNFSNLRHILFRDANQPAAAFFYSKCLDLKRKFSSNQTVVTYSPMLANQEAGRYSDTGRAKETWAIVVNSGEIQHVPVSEAVTGGGLPWKLAMWGTARDRRLIKILTKKFPSLDEFIKDQGLYRSQGVQLRRKTDKELVDPIEELIGKKRLDVKLLRGYRRVFSFPAESLIVIDAANAYVRKGRTNPIPACRPPHLIVSAAGSFSVYSDEFIVHPHPHIAIAGAEEQSPLLKALSLFLSSSFATYYKFFATPLWGVERDRVELKPLLSTPISLGNLNSADLSRWADLHDRLATIPPESPSQRAENKKADKEQALFPDMIFEDETKPSADSQNDIDKLIQEIDDLVYESMGIAESERWIIEDFVETKIKLNDGHLGDEAVRTPTTAELSVYCDVVRTELDSFIGAKLGMGYRAIVAHDDLSAMIQIDLPEDTKQMSQTNVLKADSVTRQEFMKLRANLLLERGQWFYFNRSLRVYQGKTTFLFKPLQRMHWSRSQALADANMIVSETINSLRG